MKYHRHYFVKYLISLTFLLFLQAGLVAAEANNGAVADYVLGTGDSVRIQVYGEEDMYLETRVSDRGTISYPFLGEIKVVGSSPNQIEKYITAKLKGDYFVNPKVSVDILEYREFYVNGEVEEPGGFPYQPGLTIRKAISLAGGFKERASKEKIFVIHEGASDDTPKKTSLEARVRPGDIITVEESFF